MIPYFFIEHSSKRLPATTSRSIMWQIHIANVKSEKVNTLLNEYYLYLKVIITLLGIYFTYISTRWVTVFIYLFRSPSLYLR